MRHLFTPENLERAREIKLNERLFKFTETFGSPRIDFFGESWRVWFAEGWHHHRRSTSQRISASYGGGVAAHGRTLTECLDRLDASIADVPPSHGSHCRKGCPHYRDDY